MHEVRGTWFLAGLHSFGDACHGPARPAVFTALPTYEPWVSGLDWQVYFTEEPQPEPEPQPQSCPANTSMWPRGLRDRPGCGGAVGRPNGVTFWLQSLCDLGRPLKLLEPVFSCHGGLSGTSLLLQGGGPVARMRPDPHPTFLFLTGQPAGC